MSRTAAGPPPHRAQAGCANTRAGGSGRSAEPTLVDGLRARRLVDGRRFRVLSVVDDCTRESLCLVADTLLSGSQVIRELEAVIARRGLPVQCVSDNGPEFTSLALLR